MDTATIRQLFAGPGSDTRQWVSYGWVAPDSPEGRSIRFKNEEDQVIPEGPLVTVILQPSNIPVVCRVAAGVAGLGEGDWHPLLERDEVIVAIPQGDERAGPVIIGRLYNSFDQWPSTVAGMDATTNTFAFRRVRTPYVLEVGTSLMLRSADTGTQLTFTPEGEIFLANGDGHVLAMTADVMSLQSSDQKVMFQVDVAHSKAAIYADTFSFIMGSDTAMLQTGGTVQFATSGNGPFEHVTTIEAVGNIVKEILSKIITATTPPIAPGTGAWGDAFAGAIYALGSAPALLNATAASVLSSAATDSTPAEIAAAISGGLSGTKSPNNPRLGCPGFLVG